MNDPRYWREGVPIRPTPEDEAHYARLGPIPTWPTYRPECEFHGSNEEGGLDAQGKRHCFRFVDRDQADERIVREWHERLGPH